MKKVIIVTVNFNLKDATRKLLESLKHVVISNLAVEIIAVDNGSEEVFTTNENAKVIRSDINTGFTGGSNIGIKEALRDGADYILLINNDTTVDSGLINNLFNALESDRKIGAAAPKIYFSKGHEFHKDKYKKEDLGKVLWFAGGTIDWKNAKSVHIGMDEIDDGQHDTAQRIDFSTGCCMMIKKEVLEKIGLFDEKYFLYYEDADLSCRIIKAGFEIYYVPSAVVYHDNASSTGGSGSGLHDYFLTRNQLLFGMKYAPLRTKVALIRQSIKLLLSGRNEQKRGVKDYYLHRFGKGNFF